jgi:hypothetical protein
MLMEMAMKSMEMAVEAMESMEMAPGALPHPGKVLEQRFLSPEIGLRWQRHYGTFLKKRRLIRPICITILYYNSLLFIDIFHIYT